MINEYFSILNYADKFLVFEYFNKNILFDKLNENEQEFAENIAKQIILEQKPISKILKYKHFWKFKLYTNENTLDPRGDTECGIELLCKKFDKNKTFKFLELGIGTGAISIAILHEFPNATGVGIDISKNAIEVAKLNLNSNIPNWQNRYIIKENNWLNNIDENYDLCVSNPPYLLESDIKNELIYDPYIALYGGEDGCDFYRKISEKQSQFKYILLELGYLEIIKNYFKNYEVYNDYSNLPRFLWSDISKYII